MDLDASRFSKAWPNVEMGVLIRDVAQSFKWVHDHIAEYGGDPKRVLVCGHSAGAQLAAIICTDEKYLKEQGLGFDVLIGCIPVDGDTYDIPAMIAHREFGQSKLLGHFFIAQTTAEKLQQSLFAVRKELVKGLGVGAEQRACTLHRAAEVSATGHDLFHGKTKDFAGLHVLVHKALDTRTADPIERKSIRMRGDHQDFRRGRSPLQIRHEVEAVAVRQIKVQENQSRRRFTAKLKGILSVAGFINQLAVKSIAACPHDQASYHRLIFDHEDFHSEASTGFK